MQSATTLSLKTLLLVSTASVAVGMSATAHAAEVAQSQSPPASPSSTSTAQANSLSEVVVTARRREERLQNVPVAVSVVSAAKLTERGSFSPYDLQALSTGITVTSSTGDANNVTYTIRGQTFTFGTLFPAVVTYFNDVPVNRMDQGNFFDLDNVQILRGPQGVLFGRVTDGGNVMVQTKRPTNSFGGYIEAKAGDYGMHDFDGAVNIPLIEDKLLFRAAFEIDRRDGYTENVYNGKDLDNQDSDAVRLELIARPVSRLENYTVVDYQHINQNGSAGILNAVNPTALGANAAVLAEFPGGYGIAANGNILPYQAGLTPLTPASYVSAVQSELARAQALGPRKVYDDYPSFYRYKSFFLTNTTTADLTPTLQLRNTFGYTALINDFTEEFLGDSSGVLQFCSSACAGSVLGIGGPNIPKFTQQQFSEELRLSGQSFGNALTWNLGFYADEQKPNGEFEDNTVDLGILQRVGVGYNTTTSIAGFGQAEYDASNFIPGLKFNGGYRYTSDRDSGNEATYFGLVYPQAGGPALASALSYVLPGPVAQYVANATANPTIPYGKCVTVETASILGPFDCNSYVAKSHANTYTGGASYQITRDQLVYAKVSRGYRPGGINGLAPTPAQAIYTPEYDQSVELGFKGDWRFYNMAARTNVALFHDSYTNIQQQIITAGPSGTPVQTIANVAAATVQGLEFEGTLKPIPSVTLGLDYAYTDASYDHVDTSGLGAADPCNPKNFTAAGFCTSNMFAYTPWDTISLSADYDLPLDRSLGLFRVGAVARYRTRQALLETSALNPGSVDPALTTLDFNATWSNVMGRPFDISFFMTNVTNQLYRVESADLLQNSSLGVSANYYAPPRMFGFGVKYRFGSGG